MRITLGVSEHVKPLFDIKYEKKDMSDDEFGKINRDKTVYRWIKDVTPYKSGIYLSLIHICQEEIRMDIGGRTQTGRMSIQISSTAQTLDCGTPVSYTHLMQKNGRIFRCWQRLTVSRLLLPAWEKKSRCLPIVWNVSWLY